MNELLQTLISQGNSQEDALEILDEMRNAFLDDNADPEELLYEQGLEPDYLMDFIEYCDESEIF